MSRISSHPDMLALAGLVPALIWLGLADPALPGRLAFAALVIYGWQGLFAWRRRQGIGGHGLVQAGLFALLVPASAPLWQLGLGISFAVVLGEAVFGGRGRSFVQPVVLGLAFLAFSFADQPWRSGPELPLLAALPAGLLLLASGQARLPVLAGFALGFGALLWAGAPLPPWGLLLLAGLYLAADPVVSGAAPASRLAYGLLAGALTGIFSSSAAGGLLGALVFGSLLAQIFAPLLDHLAIAAHVARRRRRARRLNNG